MLITNYKKKFAWFIIDYFSHNIDFIARARKNLRPQSTDDETILAEQTENRLCLGPMNHLLIYQQIYQVKHLANLYSQRLC